VKQSQKAKGKKQPVPAAAAQKGTPNAAAGQACKKNTPTAATSVQKRSSPSRSMRSRNKKTKVASNAVPSNADDSDTVVLADGTQVMASEVQIVEVDDSSQVYGAD
jgi:hypothetical protein